MLFLHFVLRNKHHPDLHLWACSGKRKDQDQVVAGAEKKVIVPDTATPEEKKHHVQNHKEPPRAPPRVEGTYITSEHSYQKPPSSGPDCRAFADPGNSEEDEVSSCEEEQELSLRERRRAQRPGRDAGAPAQVGRVPVSVMEHVLGQQRERKCPPESQSSLTVPRSQCLLRGKSSFAFSTRKHGPFGHLIILEFRIVLFQ